jgi:hypothetical protein
LVLFPLINLLAQELPKDVQDFFVKFMEDLIKINVSKIYNEYAADEFKSSISEEKLSQYLQMLLGGLGEPKKLETETYNILAPNLYSISGKLHYKDAVVNYIVTMKRVDGQIKLYHLRLFSPAFKEIALKKTTAARAYIKELVKKIKAGNYRQIYDQEIDEEVKKSVSYDIVKALFESLARLPLDTMQFHNYYTEEGGKQQVFEYKINVGGTTRIIRFVLKDEGGKFKLLNMNLLTYR